MKIPFLDLNVQYRTICDEITSAIESVISKSAFAGGPFVEEFEKDFAAYCNTKFAIGVGSGTEALWLTLIALGIGDGDEVITVPNSFIATAEAISMSGAKPVFVDVDKDYYTMNPELINAAITNKTKAIIPVHLFGQAADMDPILRIANQYTLFVIEDACQAHGAEYKKKRAGSLGHAGCFSFYPGKNLGAYGEAGIIVTNDDKLYTILKRLRDHGQSAKYHHDEIGWNARMDGIQGAILSVKLKYIDQWNEARRNNAKLYTDLFSGNSSVILPREAPYSKHNYHVYAIRIKNREHIQERLKEKEIMCGIHYPVPIHLQKPYNVLNYTRGDFPVCEMCADEYLSLPMYAELEQKNIQAVVHEFHEVLEADQ
jgi:dTDP-4-amino-4,6-dideoxygalactose transaminase